MAHLPSPAPPPMAVPPKAIPFPTNPPEPADKPKVFIPTAWAWSKCKHERNIFNCTKPFTSYVTKLIKMTNSRHDCSPFPLLTRILARHLPTQS